MASLFGGLGIKPIFVSIVDIIALHSIAINNSWYTLVLLARRTCTTSNFNWTVNEGRMLEVRLSITIYMTPKTRRSS